MKKFKLIDNIVGWVVFAIAATVYIVTSEPTASFWDCGEFITSAFKLEVGHPPGAPFFMLLNNIFSHFTDATMAARMVNSISAISSALTILFLFWSITHIARKLLIKDEANISSSNIILVLGCGLVGALAYTFSDTFWFSAVEGEVYALSSLFTAVVFWLILKWEENADAPHADKWIILIAYLMGLSIGVHLLNLLCIPAIVLVYYYKKFSHPTIKGTVYALLISFVMIALMMFGVVQGLVEVGGWFELLFVNVFEWPYDSGLFAYVIVIAGLLIWGIWETMREKPNEKRMKLSLILSVTLLGIPFLGSGATSYVIGFLLIALLSAYLFMSKKVQTRMLNTTLLSLLVIVIGYSTYALILIRSTADTPMNQNNPNNIFTLRYYLAREQYGETPLLYGSTYVSELKRKRVGDYLMSDMKKGDPTWTRVIKTNPNDKDKYFISTYSQKPVYIDETCTLFPRMYSGEASHVEGYKQWGDVKGTPVKINQFGENKTVMKPTFGENLRFFFDYQLNFMYWRYFLWNFSGRQNDIQGYGGILNGNWITGIKFLDAARLGPQDNMPVDIANNKAHNVFYMLPLILGLIGIAFQLLRKDEKGTQNFLIVFFLFFMTGIAIVMYLNQTPYQPRERDYAYAGSFYAFCIWIGLGVAGIAEALKKLKLSPVVINCIASLVCLIVPLQMASQTWDDHDRSGRTAARDFGRNYLESCDPNAVIITYGDNDTFPLWYVQEVEGVRTDVRVCNSSYAQTDWYINQMKRQAYNSAPLPISMTHDKYIQGGARDGIYIVPKVNQPIELGAALNFVLSDDPKTKIDYVGELNSYFPANKLVLKVDSAAVVATNTISSPYYPFIQKELELSLEGKNVIQKFDLALLDLVYTNQWKRPVYFATTVPPNIYAMYGNYMQKTGLAWQIVPMNTKGTYLDVNTDKMYENVMNKFRFGGIDKPGLYLDPTVMNMCKAQRQTVFGDLARNLIQEGKIDSAKQVLDKCVAVFPEFNVPYDYSIGPIAEMYYKVGEKEKAQAIYKRIIANNLTDVEWMLSLKPSLKAGITDELDREMNLLRYQLGICYQYDKDFAEPYIGHFNGLMEQYQPSSANK